MTKKRDYKKEYAEYHGSEEQKKRRAERNKARRKAVKKHGEAALEGKEVHHVDAPRKGSLKKSRTRVVSKETNRKIQPKRS